MKSGLFNRTVADRGARLARVDVAKITLGPNGLAINGVAIVLGEHSASATDAEFPLPQALPSSQDRALAAGADADTSAPAAFSVACSHASVSAQAKTAPANNPWTPALAGAVSLSDASVFILSLIAAHEGRTPADVLAILISAAGDAIGLSPLLESRARDSGCLADLPGYARAAANRFRSGGP